MSAQETQLWLDAFGIKKIGKFWEYEGNVGYNKLLQKEGWADYYLCNTFTWAKVKWYNFEASIEVHYTYDPTFVNILEVRQWVGQRFIFTQHIKKLRLAKPYFYWRLEQRFLDYQDRDTLDYKARLRLRLGSQILLNSHTMTDGTMYIPFYGEGFFNFNGEAIERYAARNRWAIGFGYYRNKIRYELMTYSQRSRDTIEDDLKRSDFIVQFKVNYFFD